MRHGELCAGEAGETTAHGHAEAPLRQAERFAQFLAHELQTPIGQVELIADLLQRVAPGDPLQSKWLQALEAVAAGMRQTVAAVLALSTAAAEDGFSTSIDLTAVCRDVIASEDLEGSGHCRTDWKIQRSMVVMGCGPQIRLLMRNLLSNAAKYSRGVDRPTVHVSSAELNNGWVQVTVEDNGAGFDASRSHELFQPFRRLHTESTCEGTGLGLSIAKRVVEAHGGWIRGTSTRGHGAVFDFCLPAVTSH